MTGDARDSRDRPVKIPKSDPTTEVKMPELPMQKRLCAVRLHLEGLPYGYLGVKPGIFAMAQLLNPADARARWLSHPYL